MRLEVVDWTGLVTGARSGGVVVPDVVGQWAVVGLNDPARELAVEWSTSACATGAAVTLQARGGVLDVNVAVDKAGGCDLLRHKFVATLALSRTVGDTVIVVSEREGKAQSWGAALLASDGRTRPLLAVDRSGRTTSVTPLHPAGLDPQGTTAVVAAGPDERTLVVSWIGDVCDNRIDVVVDVEGAATTFDITLANESQVPCVGRQRVEGIAVGFADPVDPQRVVPSLVSRH